MSNNVPNTRDEGSGKGAVEQDQARPGDQRFSLALPGLRQP
jgi:hypothetical protein